MSTIISALIFSGLLGVLFNLRPYLKERRLLRLAKAKLAISQSVTAMEELMLSGELSMGEKCHDKVFKTMLFVQSADYFSVNWKFWHRISAKEIESHNKLHAELKQKGSNVSEPLRKFSEAYFCAYKNQKPIESKLFFVWVACSLLGFIGVLGALVAIHKYRSMNRNMAEWYLARALCAQPA